MFAWLVVIVFVAFIISSSWAVVWLLFVEFVMLVIDDSSNVVSLVNDSSNVYIVCVC